MRGLTALISRRTLKSRKRPARIAGRRGRSSIGRVGLESLESRILLSVLAAEPFERIDPLGSLIYASGNEGKITSPGAGDDVQFFTEAGQTVSAVAHPDDPAATLSLRIPGTSALFTASGPGQSVALPPQLINSDGNVAVSIAGNVSTDYSLDIYRNTSLEAQVGDSADGNELDFTDSHLPLGSGRFAAVGTSTPVLGTTTVFTENFDGGSHQFTINNSLGSGGGLWHVTTGRQADALPLHSPPQAMYFGQDETDTGGGNYNTSSAAGGAVTSPVIALPDAQSTTLQFNFLLESEQGVFLVSDIGEVEIDSGFGFFAVLTTLDESLGQTNGQWATGTVDLSGFAGGNITLRFSFDTIDSFANNFEGWYIDDVRITQVVTVGPEVDEYEIDLTGMAGQPVDIVLTRQTGAPFIGESLQLLDTDGSTLLADALPDPLGRTAFNYDLSLLDFTVPADGVYTLRLTSFIAGDYSLLVTDDLLFESEPNDKVTDPLRSLDQTNTAVGFVSQSIGGAVFEDPQGDTFGLLPPQYDIASITASVVAGELVLTAEFFHTISAPSVAPIDGISGFWDLDLDLNPNTGDASHQMQLAQLGFVPPSQQGAPLGVDMYVDFLSEQFNPGFVDIIDTGTQSSAGSVPITFNATSFELSIPLSLLNDDGNLHYGTVFGNTLLPTDAAPDSSFGTTFARDESQLTAAAPAPPAKVGYLFARPTDDQFVVSGWGLPAVQRTPLDSSQARFTTNTSDADTITITGPVPPDDRLSSPSSIVNGIEVVPTIVVGDDPALHVVDPGVGFDGVASLQVFRPDLGGFVSCTGSLLSTGLHLLTAAHCVADDFGGAAAASVDVTFDLPSGSQTIAGNRYFIQPDYNGDVLQGDDIAVIELAEEAPAEAERYEIYRDSDDVGQVFQKVGYGRTGTGDVGDVGAGGTKRSGFNTYDSLADVFDFFFGPGAIRPGTQLAFDFDNGDPFNDGFGTFFSISHTGLGLDLEIDSAPGDSGGPNFVTVDGDRFIAGVTSYGFGGTAADIDSETNFTFGEFAGDTRVSFYAGWIDSIVVDPILVGPSVVGVEPLAGTVADLTITELAIEFSETITTASANDTANYDLRNDAGDPIAVTPSFDGDRTATLQIDAGNSPLPIDSYVLTIDGDSSIRDLDGNPLNSVTGAAGGSDHVHAFDIVFPIDPGGDLYELTLAAGQSVTIQTATPLDDPQSSPANELDPALLLLGPDGMPVADDADALDGRNAQIIFEATAAGTYAVQVSAQSGEGEYLISVATSGAAGATLPYHEDFTTAAAFLDPIVGTWQVQGGRYHVTAPTNQVAVALLELASPLSDNVLLSAVMQSQATVLGRYSNAFFVYDYQGPDDYKFAGGFFGGGKLRIGRVAAGMMFNDVVVPDAIFPDTDYSFELLLANSMVALLVDGETKAAHDFSQSVTDGDIGLAASNAVAQFDDFQVQQVTGATLPYEENFDDATADRLQPIAGPWQVIAGRYEAAPTVGDDAISLIQFDDPLPDDLAVSVLVNSPAGSGGRYSNGAVIFDYQGPGDFKFAGGFFGAGNFRIGHAQNGMWQSLVVAPDGLAPGVDVRFDVFIEGSVATVRSDGQIKATFDFGQPLNDGGIGLATTNAIAQFDEFSVRQLTGPYLPYAENFDDGVADDFQIIAASWQVNAGRFEAAPVAGNDPRAIVGLDDELPGAFEIAITMHGQPAAPGMYANAMIVLNYQGPTDFIFVGAFFGAGNVRFGRVVNGQWFNDLIVAAPIAPGADHDIHLAVNANSVTLTVDQTPTASHDFAQPLDTGRVGLTTRNAISIFDDLSIEATPPTP